MPDDAMDLDPTGVEAAARAISSVRYTAARQRANGQFVDEQDEFTRMALAAARHLRAVPESDEQRDKADQWDAAQPMIAAMTDVVVVARKMHTDSRVRLLNAYDWMELTNALNAVTRLSPLSPDEAAGGE